MAYVKNQEENKLLCDAFKAACRQKGVHIPMCIDIQGRSLRLGKLPGNKPVRLKKGSTLYITSNRHIEASNSMLYCEYAQLPFHLKPEDKILIDGGNVSFTVKRIVRETEVLLKTKGIGTLSASSVGRADEMGRASGR
jgi:pyruvate kinase